jgi:hypothetical protein
MLSWRDLSAALGLSGPAEQASHKSGACAGGRRMSAATEP